MRRAGRLLAAYQRAETDLMTEFETTSLSAEAMIATMMEILREELARILLEQDHGPARSDEEIERRIALNDAEKTALRRRSRANDFTKVESQVLAAARALNLAISAPLPPELGRKAVDLQREILDLENEVLDGADGRGEPDLLSGHWSRLRSGRQERKCAARHSHPAIADRSRLRRLDQEPSGRPRAASFPRCRGSYRDR